MNRYEEPVRLKDEDHAHTQGQVQTAEPDVRVRSEEPAERTRVYEPEHRYRDERSALGSYQLGLPEALNVTRDRVRWGPIWTGVFTAAGTMLLLGVLGVAIGLTSTAGGAGLGGMNQVDGGQFAAIWSAVSAILAFFIGGWAAGRSAAVFDRGWGAWNGALVFIVFTMLLLLLTTQGILGTLGSLASGGGLDLGVFAYDLPVSADAADPRMARIAAWGTLIALVVGLTAAALGGALGTRRTLRFDRLSADVDHE